MAELLNCLKASFIKGLQNITEYKMRIWLSQYKYGNDIHEHGK